ncbi:hypothetical protein AOPFMNJM_3169 [Methylobacterium jeotgali]|uniref:DUF1269 domain-containing protein n=2 Tax=Methylobacteriaceae TaxID=119045 RepID=A0ABQ4SY78_9HYPH|nr:hypothetical protein AwMethylo_14670 [Methylobacterium sp.]GJE07837.1 hypothetical protein AOPFMNJM_3169 [Methylobacterium jeotgali]
MARMELIAGSFGTGRADWINFEFHLPRKQRLPIEAIASVEENGEYLERSFLGFLSGGAKGAVGIGATAAVVGLFAAPIAAVGAIGLTAAAIGGGLGAFGGSIERKLLMQVIAADGRGFVAICERDVPGEIRKAVSAAHAVRMRQQEAVASAAEASRRWQPSSLWNRPAKAAAASAAVALPAAAAIALPAPPVVAAVDMQPDEQGVFTATTEALVATAGAAGTAAADAYSATVDAVDGAWTAVKARLPWGGA